MIFETAFAKVNLYLHLVGKRADGYHLLDSLFAFADTGDVVTAEKADSFSLNFSGPYGAELQADEHNSVVKAARLMCEALHEKKTVHLHLEKNLPLASGIGGGSADAAATMRLLMRFFDKKLSESTLDELALRIGADVPACLRGNAVFVSGIGEKVTFAPAVPRFPLLLVNPNIPLSTPAVFKKRTGAFSTPQPMTSDEFLREKFIAALQKRHNDLKDPAGALCPPIFEILNDLKSAEGCLFATMSGSGATCAALFDTAEQRDACAVLLSERRPKWWISKAFLI